MGDRKEEVREGRRLKGFYEIKKIKFFFILEPPKKKKVKQA